MSLHRLTHPTRWFLAAVALALPTSACHDDSGSSDELPRIEWVKPAAEAPHHEGLHRSHRVPDALARLPRFSRRPHPPGLRCAPDGILGEWRKNAAVRWIEATPIPQAKSYHGPSDQHAKVALISYGGGLSFAIQAQDDVHLPAIAPGSFGRSDGVELSLWPLTATSSRAANSGDPPPPLVGVRLWLGSKKRLVRFDRPHARWREDATQSFGSEIGGGWQIEARLPLSVLTPLPKPQVKALRYRITIYDSDAAGKALPTLRAEGVLTLTPPLEVPEAVQRRGSIRICMADHADEALWGYKNGWRCALPYRPRRQPVDDSAPARGLRLTYARLPTPPLLRYLRERLLLVNYPGLGHSVAGILAMDGRLVSLLRLGIVGTRDPGNALTRNSDAEPLRLPDGTWAVAVTHAYPAREGILPTDDTPSPLPPFGARCARGYEVFLSIIALRGAPHCTPHEHVPKPDPPPRLEEVLRVRLDDCAKTQTYDWSISRDRKTVKIRDSLFPRRPVKVFTYGPKGIYERRGAGRAIPHAQKRRAEAPKATRP